MFITTKDVQAMYAEKTLVIPAGTYGAHRVPEGFRLSLETCDERDGEISAVFAVTKDGKSFEKLGVRFAADQGAVDIAFAEQRSNDMITRTAGVEIGRHLASARRLLASRSPVVS